MLCKKMIKQSIKSKEENSEEDIWQEFWQQESSRHLTYLKTMKHLWLETSSILSKYIKKFVNKSQEYYFIELGCGGGSFLPYLQKKFKNLKIFGIEKSTIGCILAQENLGGIKSPSSIVQGDINNSPLIPEKFDIVFSFGLIEHFDSPDKIISKHYEILKQGGLLLIYIPNLLGLQGKFLKSKLWKSSEVNKENKKGWIWGMKIINIKELKKWLDLFNLKNIKICPTGGIFPMFILESYHPTKESSKKNMIYYIYRYFLFFPFVFLNIPFLFRLNSYSLSPYLVITAIKANK